MLQLLHSIFQSLQLYRWEFPAFDRTNDCLHHVLADIIGTVHIIEIIVMLVHHKMVDETFEDFEQDGSSE